MAVLNITISKLFLICLLLLTGVGLADAKIVSFGETYQDYQGTQHDFTNANLVAYPMYTVTDNGNNYTITRFNETVTLPKRIWIDYQFQSTRVLPVVTIQNFTQINQLVTKVNASLWYLTSPWSASQVKSVTDDLIDMGVFQRTTSLSVVDSNGSSYVAIPKVIGGNIRLYFNPQDYTAVIYPLILTENTITVSNATTSSWSANNISLRNARLSGNYNVSIALNSSYFSGLAIDFDMQETTGVKVRNVNNASGLFNTTNEGTWTGSASVNYTGGRLGGTALNFDGINDNINAGNNVSLRFTGSSNFSVSVVTNFTTSVLNKGLFGKYDSTTNRGFFCLIDSASKLRCVLRNNSVRNIDINTNSVLVSGVSLNITVTYNGSGNASGLKMYVNGTLLTVAVAEDDLSSGSIETTTDFMIGQIGSNLYYYLGSLNRFTLLNSILSASEIPTFHETIIQTQANISIWQQNSSAGNATNRTRINIANIQVNNNTVDLYTKPNATASWSLLMSNASSSTWYALPNHLRSSSQDYLIVMNGNGSSTPYFTSLEWDSAPGEVFPNVAVAAAAIGTAIAAALWAWRRRRIGMGIYSIMSIQLKR